MANLVSVCMITYNHEKYIAQALDSVLMQRTNFEYEIIIGEDCSSDKTREIVLDYKSKYPQKIKLLLQKENVGVIQNFLDTLRASTCKYIALLEGDDYWVNPNKLQMQVDFLELHPDFSFCFHNAYVYDDDINSEYLFNDNRGSLFYYNLTNDREVEGWELINKWICPTASVVFSNKHPLDRSLFEKTKYGDIVLFLFLAKHGKIYYFNQVSSVYRRLQTGQRKVYSKNIPGKITHTQLLIKNFNDIPYLEVVCSKILCILIYTYLMIQLRRNGLKEFKKYTNLYKKYFIKVIKMKSPIKKYKLLFHIFYENIRMTAKAVLNYKI